MIQFGFKIFLERIEYFWWSIGQSTGKFGRKSIIGIQKFEGEIQKFGILLLKMYIEVDDIKRSKMNFEDDTGFSFWDYTVEKF